LGLAPIPEKVRRRVVEAVAAGERRSVVARRHKISQASVARICRDAKIIPMPMSPGQRRSVDAASEAMRTATRHRRALLSSAFMDVAERIVGQGGDVTSGQLFAPAKVYSFGGRDNVYVEQQIPEPDAKAKQALVITAAIATEKSILLDRYDREDGGTARVRGSIIELVDHLHATAELETPIRVDLAD
jgi:hypothetical protein